MLMITVIGMSMKYSISWSSKDTQLKRLCRPTRSTAIANCYARSISIATTPLIIRSTSWEGMIMSKIKAEEALAVILEKYYPESYWGDEHVIIDDLFYTFGFVIVKVNKKGKHHG
jgi:hypothetical protein